MTNTSLTLTSQAPRNLVVAGQNVTPSISQGADWRQVVAFFVLNQDCKSSSRELYKRTLTQFFVWIEETGRKLDTLTREDILEYKSYLFPDSETERKYSALTAGSYLVAVRKFYEFAESYKLYPNIAKGIKTPSKTNTFKKRYLHESEIENLLAYYDEKSLRDFAIVNLCIRTGLRTIEIVRADIADIDIVNGKRILRVWGKGHTEKDALVVLTDKAYLPIKKYLETSRKGAKGNEPLFTSNSRQNAGERLTTKTISTICKEGLKAIGLDSRSYTAHSLRHTTASMILEAGGTLFDVQKVLRHTSVNTSQIYTKMKEEEQRLQTPPEALLDKIF